MINSSQEVLQGHTIILLRAKEQSQEVVQQLKRLGAHVVLYPLIELVQNKDVEEIITQVFVDKFENVILTSVNGVRIFHQFLLKKNIDFRSEMKKLYVIGPKTRDVCLEVGFVPESIPDCYDAEGLLEALENKLSQQNVLIAAAQSARDILPLELEKRGSFVTVLPIYQNVKPNTTPTPLQNGDLVVFTSSSTADRFFNDEIYQKQNIIAFCIGHVTEETVKKFLDKNVYVADKATIESLVDKLIDYTQVNSKTNF